MGAVINNYEQLRDFANELNRFLGLIEEAHDELASGLTQLGDTWQDEQYEQFREVFSSTQRVLQKFLPIAETSVRQLRIDADVLEENKRITA